MASSALLNPRYQNYYERISPFLKRQEVHDFSMIIFSLVAIALFGIFAIRPTLTTITSLQQQINDKSYLNAKLDEKINAIISADEEYHRITEELPLIYNLLPDRAEFPSLIRKIENLAIENNATVSAMQISPMVLYDKSKVQSESESQETIQIETIMPDLVPISYSFSLNGQYSELINFLNQLTTLDRIITINTLDLKLTGATETDAILSVTAQANFYYYPLKLK
ncbi:type 4a pilus biogenesis protein PilO [Candidatus Gottesmanbacteria bacterium]|nr:type 4a pilus biogenesis protein PilO [Candidatus Gottesmanbacteria bacterium]